MQTAASPVNRSFAQTFGRLPHTRVMLLVTMIAGLTEGLGLALFVPLLEIMSDASERKNALIDGLRHGLEWIGLEFAFGTVLILIVVLISGSFGMIFLQRTISIVAKNRYIRNLRAQIFDTLLASSWSHISEQASGSVVNDLAIEAQRAGEALVSQILVVSVLLQMIVLASVSLIVSWELLIVAVGFSAIIFVITRPLLKRAGSLGHRVNVANREFGAVLVDYLRGLRLIKATGSAEIASARIGDANTTLYRLYRAFEQNAAFLNLLLQLTPVFVLAAMIAVAHLVFELEASQTLVFILVLARIAPRIAEVQQRFEAYAKNIPAYNAIRDSIESCERNAERQTVGKGFSGLTKGVRVENAWVSYIDGQTPAVKGTSIEIPSKKMTAIVGGSGAGKSTLIDLIVGMRRPDSGHITIDGVDLSEIDLDSWRQRLGYVSQDIIVFNDTLRANLLFGGCGATDQEIREILDIADLNGLTEEFRDGLDTVIGENGVKLSGGQKQRVALARALLRRPELLILDEATSSLDNESERMIQNAIDAIANHLTIVVVAHRLSTVRRADRIYVIEQGKIVECGQHDELLALNGRFAELYNYQFA